jgi:hypothetical protein
VAVGEGAVGEGAVGEVSDSSGGRVGGGLGAGRGELTVRRNWSG